MPERTKRQLILEIFERESMTGLGEAEVRAIQKGLGEALGKGETASRGYIARVVAGAGKPVRIADSFSPPAMGEPYSRLFEGVLKFSTLEQAEQSLRQIGRLYREFKAAGDKQGMTYARSVALVGKRRARAATRRAKQPALRDLKHEIAEWFALWLSAPELFDDWLDLRKESPDFRKKGWSSEPG